MIWRTMPSMNFATFAVLVLAMLTFPGFATSADKPTGKAGSYEGWQHSDSRVIKESLAWKEKLNCWKV